MKVYGYICISTREQHFGRDNKCVLIFVVSRA